MSGIADLRLFRGLSVEELAAKLDVPVDTIVAFEELLSEYTPFVQEYINATKSGMIIFPVDVAFTLPNSDLTLDLAPISPNFSSSPARVVAVKGPLGSGKTHFLKKVAAAAQVQKVPTVGLLGNNEWLDPSLFTFSQEVSSDSDLKNIWRRWDSRLVNDFGRGLIIIDGVNDDAVSNMVRYGRSFDIKLPLIRTEVEENPVETPNILNEVKLVPNFSLTTSETVKYKVSKDA